MIRFPKECKKKVAQKYVVFSVFVIFTNIECLTSPQAILFRMYVTGGILLLALCYDEETQRILFLERLYSDNRM